jgi:hypothetical protein
MVGNGEGEWWEGKGDERRGKKRGRGLNEYEYTAVVCFCGGGQNVGDGQHLRT